jgi:hypothetical protein
MHTTSYAQKSDKYAEDCGNFVICLLQHLVAFVDTFLSILSRRIVLWFPYYGLHYAMG